MKRTYRKNLEKSMNRELIKSTNKKRDNFDNLIVLTQHKR
jgi:hypothetical protein